VVTLATVGYGDLHPTTDAAKLFTVVYVLVGLGVFAAFIAELTKHRAARIARFRSHDETPDPGAGSAAPGAAPPHPVDIDEDAAM
jgi:hypothetical protein